MKLKIGDKIEVLQEYFGVRKGKYKIIELDKNHLGGDIYVLTLDRKNAVKRHYLHAEDVDMDIKDIKKEEEQSHWEVLFAGPQIVRYI